MPYWPKKLKDTTNGDGNFPANFSFMFSRCAAILLPGDKF